MNTSQLIIVFSPIKKNDILQLKLDQLMMEGRSQAAKNSIQSASNQHGELISPPSLESMQFLLKKQPLNQEQDIDMQPFPEQIREEDENSNDSDEEAQNIKEINMKKELLKQNLKQNANRKMVVGTGFSMDVTQFFEFQKKKELSSDRQRSLLEQITGSRWAWLLLLYTVTSGAMIPGWIMNIRANKLLRISWRFFMQMIMVIPFVLYEYRTSDENTKKKYNLSYIFDNHNIIKPLASSLATSLWFTMIILGFEWTSISHSIVMGSLSNFFLSIGRTWRNSSHDLQSGGQILVILGIVLVFIDEFKFNPDYLSPHDMDVNNRFYFQRAWWQRMAFDLSSFAMSFFMSEFSKYTSDLKNYYPPFLSMLIVNTSNCILMAFSCYFINGCDFNFDSFFGIWSLFSNLHFTGFMFMAIMLSLGQMISIFMITRMFPDPIIPALAMTLEPFVATFILDLVDIQRMPDNFTLIGYLFMVPGMSLILVGQCLFQRISSKNQNDDKRAVQLMKQLKAIQAKLSERKQRKASKSQRTISFKSNQIA